MRIYTKTGDAGDTSLFGGGRVPKHHVRVAAYGAVDELNAVIGLARAAPPPDFEEQTLAAIQADLFAIGGRLASPDPAKVAKALAKATVDDTRVAALEAAIDRAEHGLPPLTAFIIPGGSEKGARLHHARTVCRRAERAVVALNEADPVAPEILRYLNRLSDLLFVLARLANHQSGAPEATW